MLKDDLQARLYALGVEFIIDHAMISYKLLAHKLVLKTRFIHLSKAKVKWQIEYEYLQWKEQFMNNCIVDNHKSKLNR